MQTIVIETQFHNRRDFPVTKNISRGTIVEVTGPTSQFSSAVVVGDYHVTVPPNSTTTICFEAWPFSGTFNRTDGLSVDFTPYIFSGSYQNQEDLSQQLQMYKEAEATGSRMRPNQQNVETSLSEMREKPTTVGRLNETTHGKNEFPSDVGRVSEKQSAAPPSRIRPKRLTIEEFGFAPLSGTNAKTSLPRCGNLKIVLRLDNDETNDLQDAIYSMVLYAKCIGPGKKRKSWDFHGRLNPRGTIEVEPTQLERGWYRFAVSITFSDIGGKSLPIVAFGESKMVDIY